MRKKSKHIGGLFMLRSVGDESVDILFIMGDNGKSLSDELVCDSDHGEFSRLPVLPEPRVCFPTFTCWQSMQPHREVLWYIHLRFG